MKYLGFSVNCNSLYRKTPFSLGKIGYSRGRLEADPSVWENPIDP